MANDYWVDHSDPPYPAIRHRSYLTFDPQYNELMSLSAARREIKEKCRSERQHWLAVQHTQLAQTPEVIEMDAKNSRGF